MHFERSTRAAPSTMDIAPSGHISAHFRQPVHTAGSGLGRIDNLDATMSVRKEGNRAMISFLTGRRKPSTLSAPGPSPSTRSSPTSPDASPRLMACLLYTSDAADDLL